MPTLKILASIFALGLFSATVLADEAHVCLRPHCLNPIVQQLCLITLSFHVVAISLAQYLLCQKQAGKLRMFWSSQICQLYLQ